MDEQDSIALLGDAFDDSDSGSVSQLNVSDVDSRLPRWIHPVRWKPAWSTRTYTASIGRPEILAMSPSRKVASVQRSSPDSALSNGYVGHTKGLADRTAAIPL